MLRAYKLFFETLCSQNRLQIINALQRKPLNVKEIMLKTGLNQSTLSHNIRRLEKCGFVSAKRNGKYRIYALNRETIKPLMKLINKHISRHCRKLCGCTEKELLAEIRR
ncbi:winged helix-turn-helix transcriptional regulator [Candidatus Woesearchaeota archaeon]|nr:winged helix-turn-helix transcriptional regulator [Candidatus Woesearchaeota archaeon]